ncbi:MAG: FlgD immunoglobulin-like domain containing protein, partial [bacterium]
MRRGIIIMLLFGVLVSGFLATNLHSQTLQPLTTNSADDIQPQWSPDGSQLVFASNRGSSYGLWMMDADGTGLHQLVDDQTLDEAKPHWVGNRIVFNGTKGNESHIYIINNDGTGLRRVSHVNNVNAPKLSPDALKIAFDSAGEFDYTGWHQPWVVNVDGTGLTHLRNSGHGMWVVWAHDANHIAYALGSNHDQPHDIYVIEANGSNETTIAANLLYNTQLAYSPNGNKVVYLSGTTSDRNISVMNWDGSGKTQLTSDPSDEYFAASLYYVIDEIWSPDNSKIVFTSEKNGNADIFTIGVDGSDLTQWTTHTAEDFEAVWSPNGSKIAFVSNRNGNNDIWIINLMEKIAAVSYKGKAVTAWDGNGNPTWTYTANSSISEAIIADLNGDGSYEVLAGTRADGSDMGVIYALHGDGTIYWSFKTGAKGTESPYWPDDHYVVSKIVVANVDNDRKQEVVSISGHDYYYPTRLCVLDALTGVLEGEYWNPGICGDLVITDLEGDGSIEILVGGGNNDHGNDPSGFCLDGSNVHGEAPPDYGDFPPGTQKWYTYLPHFGATATYPYVGQLSIVDLDDDGIFEIEAKRKKSDGSYTCYLNKDGFLEVPPITGIYENREKKNEKPLSTTFFLSQNYPNPFNPHTKINYVVEKSNNVIIRIYNQLGQRIRTLVNETKAAGEYTVVWDGRDDYGNSVASGTYFYQLKP